MYIKKNLVYSIIPARSGSTSVKDKNIRLLGKHPLIAYSIAASKLTNEIERTIVTTDSDNYRQIALKYGAEAPFLRPKNISGPYSTDLDFMEHVIHWLDENEGTLPEYWIHLRPTSPFRDPAIITEAIRKMQSDPKATSLRSAHLTDLCPRKWFKINSDGYYETFDGISTDDANNPRQTFPPTYIPNGYVDVLKTEFIVKNRKLHGEKILPFQVPPVVDIDYEYEFNTLERDVNNFMSPIVNWMDDIISSYKKS